MSENNNTGVDGRVIWTRQMEKTMVEALRDGKSPSEIQKEHFPDILLSKIQTKAHRIRKTLVCEEKIGNNGKRKRDDPLLYASDGFEGLNFRDTSKHEHVVIILEDNLSYFIVVRRVQKGEVEISSSLENACIRKISWKSPVAQNGDDSFRSFVDSARGNFYKERHPGLMESLAMALEQYNRIMVKEQSVEIRFPVAVGSVNAIKMNDDLILLEFEKFLFDTIKI